MYEPFYGLTAEPFRLSPDHRFCFNHDNFAKAKAYIDYALHRAEGFVMITGKPGTGKTTLVHDLLERLAGTGVKVAMLMSTRLDADDLLRMTAYAFGLDPKAPNKALVLQRLMECLSQQFQHGKRSLLIIDESQDLSIAALEELRLLTNLEQSGQPLLQIVLIGQESLRELVRSPQLEQLHQRLLAAWHLEPLSPQETIGYIQHRLKTAGWIGDPEFMPGVMKAIYGFSGGVPRMINLVCSRLLLHGFIEERHVLTVADAAFVLGELRQEELIPQPDIENQDAANLAMVSGEAAGAMIAGRAPIDWSQIDTGLLATLSQAAPDTKTDQNARLPEIPVQPAAQPDIKPLAEHPQINQVLLQEDHANWTPDTTAASDPVPLDQTPLSRTGTRHRWFIGLGLGLGLAGVVAAVYLREYVVWRPLVETAEQWIRATASDLMATPNRPDTTAPTPDIPRSGLKRSASVSLPPPPLTAGTPGVLGSSPSSQDVAPSSVPAPSLPVASSDAPVAESVSQTPDTPVSTSASPSNPVIAATGESLPETLEATPAASMPTPAPEPERSQPITVRVLFGWNSAEVDARFAPILDGVVARLRQSTQDLVEITGYSDRHGKAAYNLDLSRRRANAVADYLVQHGIPRERLRIEGRGRRDLVESATPEISESQGRMVDVTVSATRM